MAARHRTKGQFNPVPWALAIVIVLVFGGVTYRVVTVCEPSTFELLKQLRVTLGGCPEPGPDKQSPPVAADKLSDVTTDLPASACEKALAFAPVPMCDLWQTATESRIAGGSLMSFKFVKQRFPIFQFEIGAFIAEQQKVQRYSGSLWFNDGLKVDAHFMHSRWATRLESAVDYEDFVISISPGTLQNQPYRISYGGYFDRLAKEFVVTDFTATLRDEAKRQGAQTVLRITPPVRFVKVK